MKMVWESQKILHDNALLVNPTAVRVPVTFGHSVALHIQTRQPLAKEEAKNLLENAPGVTYIDDTLAPFPTPFTHAEGSDTVYVSRLRQGLSHPNGLDLWVVADNIRKGAALNSIQIAEALVNNIQ